MFEPGDKKHPADVQSGLMKILPHCPATTNDLFACPASLTALLRFCKTCFKKPAGFPVWLLPLLMLLMASGSRAEVILVFGDSISAGYGLQPGEGWAELLQLRLGSQHKVINLSISGETTAGGRERLPKALQKHRPDIVILELGGNDGLRGYPVARTKAGLMRMITDARAGGSRLLLLGMELPPNYGRRYSQAFRQMFKQLAEETEVQFIPFFLAAVATNPALMQSDGIHPRAEAQAAMLEAVFPVLSSMLE